MNRLSEALQAQFQALHDEQRMQKLQERLTLEKGGERITVALCGHFSAGKSSLINRLAGVKLLPSSPIPTSANVVTIQHGEARAEVVRMSTDGQTSPVERIALTELAEVCTDGTTFASVRLYTPLDWLGDRVTLLDTPGIDSTDQAHELATRSALHVADVVLYVTDYNHVQSEVNLEFLKKMSDWGKPLYVLVNQIDKHSEAELPFSLYDNRLRQTFIEWNVQAAGLLYLSAKIIDHPLSQYESLRQLLCTFATQADSLQALSWTAALRQLADEHLQFAADRRTEERHRLESQLAALSLRVDDEPVLQETVGALDASLAGMKTWREQRLAHVQRDLDSLLQHAPLTPAHTRDLANAYLDSCRPAFRSGFLWFGRSTDAVRSERLTAFLHSLLEQLNTHVIFHVHQLMFGLLDELGETRTDWMHAAEQLMQHGIDETWLATRVKTGSIGSGEYLLNYCAQTAEEMKRVLRRMALDWLAQIDACWQVQQQAERTRLEAEKAALTERLMVLATWRTFVEQETTYAEQMLDLFVKHADRTHRLPEVPQVKQDAHADSMSSGQTSDDSNPVTIELQSSSQVAPQVSAEHEAEWAHMTRKLEHFIDTLSSVSSLQRAVQSLIARRRQFAERTFTVALFGAFSAGKSSFANALVGERFLPVSPNPTTAAINQVLPVTADCPHGTVIVQMKTPAQMTEDIVHSLKLLGIECESMEQGLSLIADIDPREVTGKGKPHLAFLRAVADGWAASGPLLGQQIRADWDEFSSYVADERRSCFVADLQVHHDNPLSRQGIILVDTPGADSVNARHTHVSFEYIKNADLILFVTYYNHAFSQADRDFLMQLGRVKDRFAMDKMLFVINAADLADSTTELADVERHVRTNLESFGITAPQLFSLSSRLALEGKIGQDSALIRQSGIESFETAFYGFMQKEWSRLLVHAAAADVRRVEALVTDRLHRSLADDQQNQSAIARIEIEYESLAAPLATWSAEHAMLAIRQEMDELVYYVRQRQRHQFGERFLRAFNPAQLREDVRDIRQSLRAAWFDLLDQLEQEVVRELQATALLQEQQMRHVLEKNRSEMVSRVRRTWPTFDPADAQFRFVSPPLDEPFRFEIDVNRLQRQYRSNKHFFAEQGRNALRAELERTLLPALEAHIDRCKYTLFDHYEQQFTASWVNLRQEMDQLLQEYVEEAKVSLTDREHAQQWTRLAEQLQSF